jgi:hypothetical protein
MIECLTEVVFRVDYSSAAGHVDFEVWILWSADVRLLVEFHAILAAHIAMWA